MMFHKKFSIFVLSTFFSLTISAAGFAQDGEEFFFDDDDFFSFDEDEEPIESIADPLESFNRVMFSFNDSLYRSVLKPLAVGYRVVPEPARISVANFINNLKTPVSSANALIQLDIENSASEFSRFLINSTIGIAGLFDPAKKMGLLAEEEDFGQTLAHYGVGTGFYLVIPFVGSSSLRDGIGNLANNTTLNPLLSSLEAQDFLAIRLLDGETILSLDDDTYEAFYDSSIDPYIFFRSAYVQNRAGQIEQ